MRAAGLGGGRLATLVLRRWACPRHPWRVPNHLEWNVANYAPSNVLNWYRERLVFFRETMVDVEKDMAAMLKPIPDEEPKKAESEHSQETSRRNHRRVR